MNQTFPAPNIKDAKTTSQWASGVVQVIKTSSSPTFLPHQLMVPFSSQKPSQLPTLASPSTPLTGFLQSRQWHQSAQPLFLNHSGRSQPSSLSWIFYENPEINPFSYKIILCPVETLYRARLHLSQTNSRHNPRSGLPDGKCTLTATLQHVSYKLSCSRETWTFQAHSKTRFLNGFPSCNSLATKVQEERVILLRTLCKYPFYLHKRIITCDIKVRWIRSFHCYTIKRSWHYLTLP